MGVSSGMAWAPRPEPADKVPGRRQRSQQEALGASWLVRGQSRQRGLLDISSAASCRRQ